MKIKLGTICGLLAFFLLGHVIDAKAVDKVIGYCPDDITSSVYPVGVSGQQAYVSAAVKFPSTMLQSMKGNKITKIRIGIGEGMQNVYAWVRVGSLTAKPVTMQKVETPVEGWNEVTLATAYDIDGGDIYVGYSGRQPYNKLCVWLDGDENANATFINDGSSWDDYYGQGWGSLLIQATVSGDNFAHSDLAVEGLSLDSTYYKSGSKATVSFSIVNQGETDFTNCKYTYKIDNGTAVHGEVTDGIASSAKVKISKQLDLSGLDEGAHKVCVALEWDSASATESGDDVSENDSLAKDMLVYVNEYKKNVLLEQYTTIQCVNCPKGDATLNAAVKERDNVAWVAHHVGYYTDELTIDESSSYMTFGVNAAPMATIDRAFVQVEQNQTKPAFSIGYDNAQTGAQLVNAIIDYLCSSPAFVQVTPTCSYDKDTRELTISVAGECNGIYQNIIPKTCLTVFVTENNVTAKQVQTGTVDGYTHNHVIRCVATDTFGDEVEWDGNTFKADKTVTLDGAWKPEDIRAVAFVSKPYSSNNVNNAQVLNVGVATIPGLSGIATVDGDEDSVYIDNGRLAVAGHYDSVEVFSANGAQANPAKLGHGMYIVKMQRGDKVSTKKLIY